MIQHERAVRKIRQDRAVLEPHRKRFVELVDKVAGTQYGSSYRGDRSPMPLLSMYQNIIVRSIIANDPRFMLQTHDRSRKPAVNACQTWMNTWAHDYNLHGILSKSVQDAMYWFGVVKVHLLDPVGAAMKGFRIPAGSVCVSRLSPDDFVMDTSCKTIEEVTYMAHRCWVPKSLAEDHYRTKLPVVRPSLFNSEGGMRAQTVGQEYVGLPEDLEDMTALWEVYYPRHRMIVVYQDDGHDSPAAAGGKPVQEREYVGPPEGPYTIFSFTYLPDKVIPKGPMQDIVLADEACNAAFRRLYDVTVEMKEVGLVDEMNADDGETVMRARHGEFHKVRNAQAVQTQVIGNKIAQPLVALGEAWKTYVSFIGGNLELLGGRSQQASTLGQERIINENAASGVANLQAEVLRGVNAVGRSLMWHHWYDPETVMETPYQVQGLPDAQLVRRLVPQGMPGGLERSGPPPKVKLDAYSLRPITPAQRAQTLMEFISQVYAPLSQMFMQAGMMLDVNFLLTKLAELWDQPDLPELVGQWAMMAPEQEAGYGEEGEARMPTTSRREYIRRGVSAATPASQSMQMVNENLGAGDEG